MNKITNPLPSLESEIKVQEKRMATLKSLEEALGNFSKELKEINLVCPFGSSSVEVQEVVNVGLQWTGSYSRLIREVNNFIVSTHIQDVETLAKNEHILDRQEQAEDLFAMIKTHVTPELEISREFREFDKQREEEFNKKVQDLKLQYFGTAHPNTLEANQSNDYYSVVE